ncbi:MAG: hypothetical protein H7263_05855 [Candidatus Sericytochromatia bacterium]|nr:hypothetical protein [Candidatus Sericytochromatia bacterium]
MNVENLKKDIKEQVKLAREGKSSYKAIYHNPENQSFENEFIFFIKPELTLESSTINFDKVLDTTFDKINEFNLSITDIKVLGSEYLKNYNIIAQHYGVINKLATDPLANMSEGAKENLLKFAEVDSLDKISVLGGIQFLEKYPMFNADSVDVLLQNISTKKLAGGTYVGKIKVDTDVVYLVNGFHPRQLTHFTDKGRNIVVMTVAGNSSWADARGKFIGATNPEAADPASLRNNLLKNKDQMGIPEVSQGLNGFHLSAGPVEGLVELVRYNSNFADANGAKSYKDFSFGKKLDETFNAEEISAMLENKNVTHDGKVVSVFDLTEEKSANEALVLLKQAFGK